MTEIEQDKRIWALASHLGAWAANLSGGLLGALVPLVIYLAMKDQSAFVGAHAKESLNFRLTLLVAYILNWILFFTIVGTCIAVPMFFVLWVVELVFSILASIAAMNGQPYRHPICWRLVN